MVLAACVRSEVGGRIGMTKYVLSEIADAADRFRASRGRLPTDIEELCGPEGDAERFLEAEVPPMDAWRHEILYTVVDGGAGYRLESLGADGMAGGEGEDADIVLVRRTAK